MLHPLVESRETQRRRGAELVGQYRGKHIDVSFRAEEESVQQDGHIAMNKPYLQEAEMSVVPNKRF